MTTISHKTMDKYVDGKLVTKGKDQANPEQNQGQYWWKKEGPTLAQAVNASIKFMQGHQSTRVEQLTASTRLYGNSSAFNFIGPALSRSASSSANAQSNRISFNLCAAVIDTVVSKTAKNKIVPTFITNGGVWGMQKKAEQLSKFLDGLFHATNINLKKNDMVRDSMVWGTGMVHVFSEDGEIKVERVLPHEILVDQIETINADPRQMHWVRIVDRAVMEAMFADEEDALEAIQSMSPSSSVDLAGAGSAADLIVVTESWHLRSSEDAEDGKHAICIGDYAYEEEYNKDYFPFVELDYVKRLLGHWGQGACERLQNLQGEVNRLMILVQRSMWMGGSFKVLLENGSKVVSQHINNDVGAIIHYTGTPPQYITPPMIQQDIYPYIDALIAKGFQQEGVSQLAASSMKPQGVDSGAALRTYDEIGDDRLLFFQQCIEDAVLEIGRQMIECAKDLYSERKSVKVLFPQATFVESIEWKDVKMKDDEYVLKAYPTSTLPSEPAGRLAYIQEQMQAGLISPRAGRKLMSNPDIEMSDKLANAPQSLIDNIIEEMLEEDGEYQPPEPFYDLQLAKQTALSYYNYAVLNKCPQDKLALLEKWMGQVDELTGAAQPPAPAPGQAPLAVPTATPTNNMIPNVAGAA